MAPGALTVLPEFAQHESGFPFYWRRHRHPVSDSRTTVPLVNGTVATHHVVAGSDTGDLLPAPWFTALVYVTMPGPVTSSSVVYRLVRNVGRSSHLRKVCMALLLVTSLPWGVWSIVMSMSVWLSVCLFAVIARKLHSLTSPNFCACCLLLWLISALVGIEMSCTSSFVDDVIFSRNGPVACHVFLSSLDCSKYLSWVMHRGGGRSMLSTITFFCFDTVDWASGRVSDLWKI